MTEISFTVDGVAVSAEPGQSVAAALVAAGRPVLRMTRRGGVPRGMFCGIGICFDCLVTVAGRINQRACLIEAYDGLAVSTQDGAGRVG